MYDCLMIRLRCREIKLVAGHSHNTDHSGTDAVTGSGNDTDCCHGYLSTTPTAYNYRSMPSFSYALRFAALRDSLRCWN